jgi:hypothetical protein
MCSSSFRGSRDNSAVIGLEKSSSDTDCCFEKADQRASACSASKWASRREWARSGGKRHRYEGEPRNPGKLLHKRR